MSNTPAELRPREEKPSLPACPCEGSEMALVRVNPRLGALPELRTYRCAKCGAVETVEVRQPVAAAK